MFTPEQLAEIRKTRLSRVMCDNIEDFDTAPLDAFRIEPFEEWLDCDGDDIPRIDLTKWANCCEGKIII